MTAPTSRPQPFLPWLFVVAFAIAVWLAPFLVVRLTRKLDKPTPLRVAQPNDPKPLILFAEVWPTREKINLAEIQGQAAESDVILAPKVIAHDLALALKELGIECEPRRLDSIINADELLTHERITIIYPVRHGLPPADVLQFIDKQLETLVGKQDPKLKQIQVSDIAIGEKHPMAVQAQAQLAASMKYYGLQYQAGPQLDESMNSIPIYKELQKFAAGFVPEKGKGAK